MPRANNPLNIKYIYSDVIKNDILIIAVMKNDSHTVRLKYFLSSLKLSIKCTNEYNIGNKIVKI